MAATLVDEALAVDLTLAYVAEMERLGDLVGAALREVFDGFTALDRAQLAEWLETVRPLAGAGAAEAVDLTSAYLAELTGAAPAAVDLALVDTPLDGPFLRHWHDLKVGMPWEQARAAGGSQAEMLGVDVTNEGAAARMARPGVKTRGYLRVLSPGACEWCQVVSTQLYHSADSARFGHHACKCRVVPVVGERVHSAATAINRSRLTELRGSGAIGRASASRARSRAREGARPRR